MEDIGNDGIVSIYDWLQEIYKGKYVPSLGKLSLKLTSEKYEKISKLILKSTRYITGDGTFKTIDWDADIAFDICFHYVTNLQNTEFYGWFSYFVISLNQLMFDRYFD